MNVDSLNRNWVYRFNYYSAYVVNGATLNKLMLITLRKFVHRLDVANLKQARTSTNRVGLHGNTIRPIGHTAYRIQDRDWSRTMRTNEKSAPDRIKTFVFVV